ncbi:twin-arginine translocase TatA/TatE family subunit [Corallococcus sp. AB049A]|uniref:Sec-independent protein translocase protein TatA n=1 Tax=Corallococcus interemptor TaxID=2316720 RepID=A0A3A8Q7D7_9BACT|nr:MULTISPECIES: twin-arginine translocase TatA/TatE family subunit [Corallococcus]RKH41148.1 twin-arginine translocase TatA/TatE family subunit [Corallococcus sp. AB050B]RKH59194.1 twin-arginine translocase TatA/TatE family subunit [Corallococcus interemptor]RKI59037.1 twin-arginine translocase TatA/TatE family subunit [Corallococcus sp. AB049A]
MGLKLPEILLIFAALLLLFGGSRLPQLGSSLGSALRNFKRGFSSDEEKDEASDKKAGTLSASTTVDKDVAAKAPSHNA